MLVASAAMIVPAFSVVTMTLMPITGPRFVTMTLMPITGPCVVTMTLMPITGPCVVTMTLMVITGISRTLITEFDGVNDRRVRRRGSGQFRGPLVVMPTVDHDKLRAVEERRV